MLDALLAEEKIPEEYSGRNQVCCTLSMLIGDFLIWKSWFSVKIIQNVCAMHMQVILCNDCEKRGTASFHWLYHKCPYCGSYNTRLMWLEFLENLYVILIRCRYIPFMIYATGTKRLQFSVNELVLSYCITTSTVVERYW